jgi:hypothetical protein
LQKAERPFDPQNSEVILMQENEPITRYRREIRGGLLALGAPLVVIGAWALLAPHSFFDNFPTSSRHWVSALGPYDEHLVRDFGALYLALGGLLVWAGAVLSRQLVRVALVLSLVYAVPHLIFHASNTESLSTGDNVMNIALLALAVIVPVVLLALMRPARVTAGSIKREVTYGTH